MLFIKRTCFLIWYTIKINTAASVIGIAHHIAAAPAILGKTIISVPLKSMPRVTEIAIDTPDFIVDWK